MPNEITPAKRPSARPPAEYGQAPVGPAMPPSAGWPPAKETAGVPIQRYLDALRRYKWAFLAIVATGLGLGLLVTRFIDPEYTAQTTIWIEGGNGMEGGAGGGDYGPIRQSGLLTSYAWDALLKSFEVLEPVVRETRLYVQPAEPADSVVFRHFQGSEAMTPGEYELRIDDTGTQFTLTGEDGDVLDSGAVGEPIGEAHGWEWTPRGDVLRAGRTIEFEVQNVRDVARELAENLQTSQDLGGNFLSVRLSGSDPQKLAAVLTELGDRYVTVAARLKRAKLDTLTNILSEQLAIKQQDLESAEVALESFKVSTITMPTDRGGPVAPGTQETRDPAIDRFFTMRLDLEQLQRDRAALQRVLDEAAGGPVALEALEIIPTAQNAGELNNAIDAAVTRRAELRDLLQTYTADHPDVRAAQNALDELVGRTIPNIVRALVNDIDARAAATQGAIADASRDLQAIPPRMMEEAKLERQVDIENTLYTTLKQRYEAARLAAVSSVPDVRVLDEARPPSEPSSDRRPQILSIALLASFGLGFLGIVMIDRADRRLRFPEEVTHSLGLTILGTVPHLHRRRDGNLTEENAEQVIESLRAIRLSLMHAYGGNGSLVVAVTSPGIGDGKSFVTSNLALAFTELGYSTLLIDGDVRRGCIHKLVGGTRRPGLTDLLNGDVTLDDAVQESRLPGLSVITCGTRMARGPELLARPEFRNVLETLRNRFEVVLVDCPPVGAAVDPLVIGTLTGNMVFVLRNGVTDRDFAEAKLTAIDRLPVRLLGAVLNDVSSKGVYRYYSYLPGYGTSDESGAEPSDSRAVAMHPDRQS